MSGGVAVRANLLCVTWSAARGHVFLFDLEARLRVSTWTLPPGVRGYCDATGVAMDEHFHLFVADPHNDRICHFSAFGRHLGDFGLAGPTDGDAGRDRPGVLDRPHAVALLGDTVLVGAGDRPRRRGVQRFSRTGQVLPPLRSLGDAEASFGAPRAIWADRNGLLIADTLFGRIQRFRADGTFVCQLPCAKAGVVARPVAVMGMPSGVVLFADRGDEPGLRAISQDGAPRADAAAMHERCEDAIAFACDDKGRCYVLDRGGERVQRFRPDLTFDQLVVDLHEHLPDYPAGGGSE